MAVERVHGWWRLSWGKSTTCRQRKAPTQARHFAFSTMLHSASPSPLLPLTPTPPPPLATKTAHSPTTMFGPTQARHSAFSTMLYSVSSIMLHPSPPRRYVTTLRRDASASSRRSALQLKAVQRLLRGKVQRGLRVGRVCRLAPSSAGHEVGGTRGSPGCR